jgi:hypothetical protein
MRSRVVESPELRDLGLGEPVRSRAGGRITSSADHLEQHRRGLLRREGAGRLGRVGGLPATGRLERHVEIGVEEEGAHEDTVGGVVTDHEALDAAEEYRASRGDRRLGGAGRRPGHRLDVAHALGRRGMGGEEALAPRRGRSR